MSGQVQLLPSGLKVNVGLYFASTQISGSLYEFDCTICIGQRFNDDLMLCSHQVPFCVEMRSCCLEG